MNASIRLIEEVSLNAWPALQTMLYDGWVLRFAGGYTRRANSVTPLYPSTRQADEKFEHCEALFGRQGLPTVFRLVDCDDSQRLDGALAARGYHSETSTDVQRLDLQTWNGVDAPGVSLADSVTPAWFAAYWRMSEGDRQQEAAALRLVNSILPARAFASVEHDGAIAACGLGVLQAGYVGLLNIVTDAGLRRQGFGRRVVQALLGWGRRCGAHTAYLQVVSENAPARALYAAEGFRDVYRYWYRVRA